MIIKNFYDYITKYLTPEEALMKLLESSTLQYEKLKFDDQGKAVHPIILISMAAMDLGWEMGIEKQEGDIRGLMLGTKEYMDQIFKNQ